MSGSRVIPLAFNPALIRLITSNSLRDRSFISPGFLESRFNSWLTRISFTSLQIYFLPLITVFNSGYHFIFRRIFGYISHGSKLQHTPCISRHGMNRNRDDPRGGRKRQYIFRYIKITNGDMFTSIKMTEGIFFTAILIASWPESVSPMTINRGSLLRINDQESLINL